MFLPSNSLKSISKDDIYTITMPWMPAPEDPNRLVPTPLAADVWNALRTDTPLRTVITPEGQPVDNSVTDSEATDAESTGTEETTY